MNDDELTRYIINKNRTCTRKVPYIYYELAEAAQKGALRKRCVELRIYKCQYCGHFHLTKKPLRKEVQCEDNENKKEFSD